MTSSRLKPLFTSSASVFLMPHGAYFAEPSGLTGTDGQNKRKVEAVWDQTAGYAGAETQEDASGVFAHEGSICS